MHENKYYKGIRPGQGKVPEDPNLVQQFEEEVLEEIRQERKEDQAAYQEFWAKAAETENDFARRHYLDLIPDSIEAEKQLSLVNFELLKNIYLKIAQKCGVKKEDMNFISLERISFHPPGLNPGGYDPFKNRISFDPYGLVDKKTSEGRKMHPLIHQLYLLNHEEAHATSFSSCHGVVEEHKRKKYNERQPLGGHAKKRNFKVKIQIGFLQRILEGGAWHHQDLFSAFEEGVAEKLGREATMEYLKKDENYKSLIDKKAIQQFHSMAEGNSDYLFYSANVELVDVIIDKIAQDSGLDPDFVWRAIIRSKYEGENFTNEELQKAFSEIFHSGFLDKLSKAEYLSKPEDIIEE